MNLEYGSWGFTIPGVNDTTSRLGRAAAAQVAYATAGSRLSDYRSAEDRELFSATASNDVDAYYKVAWWMAVAARLLGSRSLAASAGAKVAAGTASRASGGGFRTGSIATIYTEGAGAVRAVAGSKAGSDANLRAVLAALGYHATEGAIATQTQAAYEQSARGIVTETVRKSGEDLVPGGKGSTPWWLWVIYVGGGVIGVTLLATALRPYLVTARAMLPRRAAA